MGNNMKLIYEHFGWKFGPIECRDLGFALEGLEVWGFRVWGSWMGFVQRSCAENI